jgi:hypothetical protein
MSTNITKLVDGGFEPVDRGQLITSMITSVLTFLSLVLTIVLVAVGIPLYLLFRRSLMKLLHSRKKDSGGGGDGGNATTNVDATENMQQIINNTIHIRTRVDDLVTKIDHGYISFSATPQHSRTDNDSDF